VDAISRIDIVRFIERLDLAEEVLDTLFGAGCDGPLKEVEEEWLERGFTEGIRLLEVRLKRCHVIGASRLVESIKTRLRQVSGTLCRCPAKRPAGAIRFGIIGVLSVSEDGEPLVDLGKATGDIHVFGERLGIDLGRDVPMLGGRMGNLLVQLLGDLDKALAVDLAKPLEIA